MREADLKIGEEYGTRVRSEYGSPNRVRLIALGDHEWDRVEQKWRPRRYGAKKGRVLVQHVRVDGYERFESIHISSIEGPWAEVEVAHEQRVAARDARRDAAEAERDRRKADWLALGVKNSYGHAEVSFTINEIKALRDKWLAEAMAKR